MICSYAFNVKYYFFLTIQQLMNDSQYLYYLISKLLMLKGIVLCVMLAEYLYYGYSICNDHAPIRFPSQKLFWLLTSEVPYYWITFADLCSLAVFLTFVYLFTHFDYLFKYCRAAESLSSRYVSVSTSACIECESNSTICLHICKHHTPPQYCWYKL